MSHAAGETVWTWDLETGQILRGGATQALTGYDPDEIGSDPGWWRERIHPEDRASVLAAIDGALVGERRELVLLYRFRRKDGSYTLFLDRAFALGSDPHRPDRIVGFAREVDRPGSPPGDAREKRPPEEGREPMPRSAPAEADSAPDLLTDPMLAHLSLDRLIHELLGRLRTGLASDATLAYLLTDDGSSLECCAAAGVHPGEEPRFTVPAARGIVGRVALSGPVLTTVPQAEGGIPAGWAKFCRSFAGVPMILEGKTAGVLCAVWRRKRSLGEHDRRLLELAADRVGPALDRARLIESVRHDRDRLGALSNKLVASLEEERRRVSRELHDEIGQLLTSLRLTLQAGAVEPTVVDGIMDDLFARIRDISMSLRPPMLEDLGLGPALTWHCDRFATQTGVRVRLMTSGLERRFSPKVELAVFRIVQEALTNIARHAQVFEARVSVRGSRADLEVLILDSGSGFEPRNMWPRQSSGLTGMRERALSVGGRLFVSSTRGRGTRVSLRIPIPEKGTPFSSPVDEVP